MINVESQFFAKVALALRDAFPGIHVQSVTDFAPAEFPTVCMEEASNTMWQRTIDSGSYNNHAQVVYEINVYTDDSCGGKEKSKKIINTIDDILSDLGCMRLTLQPLRMSNATEYRVNARYSCVVSADNVIYRG